MSNHRSATRVASAGFPAQKALTQRQNPSWIESLPTCLWLEPARKNFVGAKTNLPKQFGRKIQGLENLTRILNDEGKELCASFRVPCSCRFPPQTTHERAHINGDAQLLIGRKAKADRLSVGLGAPPKIPVNTSPSVSPA